MKPSEMLEKIDEIGESLMDLRSAISKMSDEDDDEMEDEDDEDEEDSDEDDGGKEMRKKAIILAIGKK